MNKVDLSFCKITIMSRHTQYPNGSFWARLPKLLLKSSHIEIISLFLSLVNIVVDFCFCKINLYAPKFQLTIIELTLD